LSDLLILLRIKEINNLPFKEHPEFRPPPDPAATIWRYMDLAKFLSVLDKSALYFARLDQLSNVDPFEGYYTSMNLQFEERKFEDMPQAWKVEKGIKDEKMFQSILDSLKRTREVVKQLRKLTFVSSWHVQEHESAAMWILYLKSQDGIAIQSTYQSFIDSLKDYQNFNVSSGMINYIDYNKEAIPMLNALLPYLYKRKSFEHERELRAIIWTPQDGKNDLTDPNKNKFKNVFGIYVPVNIDVLIGRVYIAPTSPSWMVELIEAIVKRFGLNKQVVHSSLSEVPIY